MTKEELEQYCHNASLEISNMQNEIEKLKKENRHLKDLYNQALKDYDELLKEQ